MESHSFFLFSSTVVQKSERPRSVVGARPRLHDRHEPHRRRRRRARRVSPCELYRVRSKVAFNL